MNEQKKLAFFLPNTFTALNMACGFTAIIMAFRGEFHLSCMLLLLGAIFDSVDGRVARLTGTQSAFGEQFDSLSDLISFGIAPSLIFYFRFLSTTTRIGLIVCFLFTLCGALRLARFNANISKISSDYFQGLPIPAAACALIGFILLSLEVQVLDAAHIVPIIYILFYSVLMISNIPFPSFKSSPWVKKHKKMSLLLIILIFASVFLYEKIMLITIISSYVIFSLISFFRKKKDLDDIFDFDEKDEVELMSSEKHNPHNS